MTYREFITFLVENTKAEYLDKPLNMEMSEYTFSYINPTVYFEEIDGRLTLLFGHDDN